LGTLSQKAALGWNILGCLVAQRLPRPKADGGKDPKARLDQPQ